MNFFKEYLKKIFNAELKKIRTDIPTEYVLNHMVCDFAETVRWWMKNDKYSPEDISVFCDFIMLFAAAYCISFFTQKASLSNERLASNHNSHAVTALGYNDSCIFSVRS